jgi:L-amino acid N-acyltransferase YncA
MALGHRRHAERPPLPPRRARGRAAVVLLAAIAAPLALAPAAAAAPPADAWFEYRLHQAIGSGGGEYAGYEDDIHSQGRYSVTSLTAAEAFVHANYQWSYSSSEGTRRRGTENRDVSFSLADRRYTSAVTDLDDLDGQPPAAHAVWFWIPTGLPLGAPVDILDQTLIVTSTRAVVWQGLTPHEAIEVRGSGTGVRNDAYGTFDTSWTDTFYFDIATGMFVAERYVEQNNGFWQGERASFVLTLNVDVTGTSYPIPVSTGGVAWLLVQLAVLVGILAGLTVAWRNRPRMLWSASIPGVTVRRLKRVEKLLPVAPVSGTFSQSQLASDPELPNYVSQRFGPFIEDFARKGLLAGDRVSVARVPRGLVGIALYNKDADIGTVLCSATDVAEALRRHVRAKDFFSEWRHQVPSGQGRPAGDAYNIFDTYHILRAAELPDTEYDTDLVSRMKPQDLDEVSAVAKSVYKADSKEWLAAQLASGDVGFVARLDGKVVGFAFATFANGAGRIHTLTVAPGYRNRGVGRELMRARLFALKAMGARDVITEIAQWNLSSLQLAQSHGFVKVADMYVETVRPKRIKKDIVRR